MRMKKLMSVLCAAALFGGLLAGCGSAETTSSITESVTGEEAYVSAEAEIEVEEVEASEDEEDVTVEEAEETEADEIDISNVTLTGDFDFLYNVTEITYTVYDEDGNPSYGYMVDGSYINKLILAADGASMEKLEDGLINVTAEIDLYFDIKNSTTGVFWFKYDDGGVYATGKRITDEDVLAVIEEIFEVYGALPPVE